MKGFGMRIRTHLSAEKDRTRTGQLVGHHYRMTAVWETDAFMPVPRALVPLDELLGVGYVSCLR